MVKWKSPLFSDLRNKLGDSVVFSSWKGRPYARQLVEPANPNTTNQQAFRDGMTHIVSDWQSRQGLEGFKAGWNELASPKQILGYNLFTRYAQGSDVQADPGVGTGEVEVTYSTNIPLDQAVLLYREGNSGGMQEFQVLTSEADTVVVDSLTSGTEHEFYLGTNAHPEYAADPTVGAVAHYHHDTDAGEAVPAVASPT